MKIEEVPSFESFLKGYKECLADRKQARIKALAWRVNGKNTDSEILDYLLTDEM